MRVSRVAVLLSLLFGPIRVAAAQATFDPATLPSHEGRVAAYSLTGRGDVDGLILHDGTEVFTPPHLGPLLVQLVRPGDPVLVHGLRARAVPMMQAAFLTNTATGRTLASDAPPPAGAEPPRERPRPTTIAGTVKESLHGPRGDLNGALLEDGTFLRLPPPEAARSAARLQPGAAVAARGLGLVGPFGRVVAADRLDGPTP